MIDRITRTSFPCEFHVAAKVRKKYGFDTVLFRSSGNVIFADFRAVRDFARKMNALRAAGEKPVKAGELNAMGLIDEFMHQVFRRYEETRNPGCLRRALSALEGKLGTAKVRSTLGSFTELFPPGAVFAGGAGPAEYLAGSTGGRPHPEVALEELLMLHLANLNPANRPYRELFDETLFPEGSSYRGLVAGLRDFLSAGPPMRSGEERGGRPEGILAVLEAPFRAHPHSLTAQMKFIRDHWGEFLPAGFGGKILSAGDLAREDSKAFPTGGPGHVLPADYASLARGFPAEYPETENFTHDTEWMPNVVLLAKNVHVWLDQLSKRHGRRIARLDEVPDEELDTIARWNFTSLWLIGVWSRSPASEKIKRMTGNPEAAPSAYSVFEYEIAADLGGEEAFGSLAHRAWVRGIRLAADMVPNHTGLTSRWMKEHPDYFIQSEHPPFPGYRFTGENLSDDPAYQVRIEDGYWGRTDAAVVFQRVDNRDGRVRYIYHGNDGTNMPWNDTAQLDFLRSEVRAAVIGQILHVARKFSVIRFDAAMTLAKKHFHRLWYPQPGTGGDIPSRADHALWQEDFDAMFPVEFWREVVDRINADMPQTLLLAEAFWLLEGYFVRTLGMHRVYNSAFMHILLREDNAMYRDAIRNTLHFEPEILKRYVNFMSNPDEETAAEQFGTGDKYFAVATLMATLPGLPMFAHGQFEGLTEKYGMEYRKAYRDESPDADLVGRHEREIVPLLKLRHLFSQTADFELYDVTGPEGGVIHDIFAYSNLGGHGGVERTVVFVNNKYASYGGRIHVSAGKLPARGGGGVRYTTLGEALQMKRDPGLYYTFREQRSGLEFVRPGADFLDNGMSVILGPFQSQVFLDFREVRDHDGIWGRLSGELGGTGLPDLHRAARAVPLRPLHEAFARLVGAALTGGRTAKAKSAAASRKAFGAGFREVSAALDQISPVSPAARNARESYFEELTGGPHSADTDGAALLAWRAASALTRDGDGPGPADDLRRYHELMLDMPVGRAWRTVSHDEGFVQRRMLLVECLLISGSRFRAAGDAPGRAFPAIIAEPAVREFIGAHEYQGVEYFNREAFAEMVSYWVLQAEIAGRGSGSGGDRGTTSPGTTLPGTTSPMKKLLLDAAESAGYRTRPLANALESPEFLTLSGKGRGSASPPKRKKGTSRTAAAGPRRPRSRTQRKKN